MDPTKQKRFVPPPPPTMPMQMGSFNPGMMQQMGGMFGGGQQQGAPLPGPGMMAPQAPQVDQGQSPGVPVVPVQEQQVPFDVLQNMADNLRERQGDITNRKQALDTFQPTAAPQVPQLSPIEQQLNERMKSQMMELLSGKESAGERWDKGFARGQTIGSAVLGPLIGSMMHGVDGKTLASTGNDIQQQAQQQLAHTSAQNNARNQMLMQMSQLYENMDPRSAKNMMNLLKMQATNVAQDRIKKEALTNDYYKSVKEYGDGLKDLGQLTRGMDKDKVSSLLAGLNYLDKSKNTESLIKTREGQLKVSEGGLQLGKDKFEDKKKEQIIHNKRADAFLGNAQNQTKLGQDRFTYTKQQDQTKATVRTGLEKTKAGSELVKFMDGVLKDSTAQNALGGLKNPDLIEKLKTNAPMKAQIQDMMKAAGRTESVEDFLNSMGPPPQAPAAGGAPGLNLGALNGALGIPQQQQPIKNDDDAVTAFVTQFGKKPTVAELKKFKGGQ